jgi:hypothetical protein
MSPANTLKVASFNIRVCGLNPFIETKEKQNLDLERPWIERRDGLVDQVIWEEPDIIGFQEVSFTVRRCHLFQSYPLG